MPKMYADFAVNATTLESCVALITVIKDIETTIPSNPNDYLKAQQLADVHKIELSKINRKIQPAALDKFCKIISDTIDSSLKPPHAGGKKPTKPKKTRLRLRSTP